MAARVVYEGGGGGGDLFEGMKFFLLQRIPSRVYYKDLVTSNGGEVVKLDKQADIVIADHAKKDAPAGSISWKFIEKSVQNGSLEDVEDWRAGPAVHRPREGGSSAPTRKGRIPFTEEDDRELLAWCKMATRRGISVKGNDLYKQLEARNPRHTYHSWRDRWIKHLAHIHHLNIPDENGEQEDEEDASPQDGPQLRPPQNRYTNNRAPIQSTSLPSRPSPNRSEKRPVATNEEAEKKSKSPISKPFIVKSAAGNIFTQTETDLLMEAYEDILNLDDGQVIDAWMAWASEHTNHTAQEWRNYFNEYIVPNQRVEKDKSAGLNQSRESGSRKGKNPSTADSTKISIVEFKNIKKERLAKEKAPQVASFYDEPLSPQSSSKRRAGRRPEIQDSQEPPDFVNTLESPEQKKANPRNMSENDFKRDLLLLAEQLEIQVDEVEFNPVICGRIVPLFKLWQVVQSKEFGGFDVVEGRNLWPEIAIKLNFNAYSHPTAAANLRTCFGEILADMASIRSEFEAELALTESQEVALIEQQLGVGTAQDDETQHEKITDASGELEEDIEEDQDDDLNSPQFTPRQAATSSSSKRSFGTIHSHHSNGYNKRQRVEMGRGKEREIPSTPEEKYKEFQTVSASHTPSPLKKVSAVEEDEMSSEIEELFMKPVRPIKLTQPDPRPLPSFRNLEPETQDFHFPPEEKESSQELEQDQEEEEGQDDSPKHLSSPKGPRKESSQINTTRGTQSTNPNDYSIQEKPNSSNPATRGSMQSINVQDSSTQSQTESERHAALQEYVDHCVSLGYPQETVIEALETTSMEKEHAYEVMESLLNGDGIPDKIKGVWTQWDDEALDAKVDSEEFREIVKKHGYDRCRSRRKFLKDYMRPVPESEEEDDGEDEAF